MIEVIRVDPRHARLCWPVAQPFIDRAILRTDLSHTLDIKNEILSGVGLLWLGFEDDKLMAAATTLLMHTDKSKICLITAFSADDMEKWLPFMTQIEDYARAEKCDAVRAYGRKGWEKVLKDYASTHIVLEKALN